MKTVRVFKFTNVDDQEECNFALFNDWDMSAAITCRGCDCDISVCDIEVDENMSEDDANEYALDYAQDNDEDLVWKYYDTERG
jgi:hypothetical protein